MKFLSQGFQKLQEDKQDRHIGWLYFFDKNYFLEESDYLKLNGKLPDIISS